MLQEVADVLFKGDLHKAVHRTSLSILRSMRVATPTAKQKRPIVGHDQAGRPQVEVYEDGVPRLRSIYRKNDKLIRIHHAGAARNTWTAAMRDLGASAGMLGTGAAQRTGRQAGKANDNKDKRQPRVTIENTLSYMDRLDYQHNLIANGIRNGQRSLEHQLSKIAMKMAGG
jgi:hypothetical protein